MGSRMKITVSVFAVKRERKNMPEDTEKARILLITGRPRTGKTTLIRTLAARLPDYRLGGFYTGEMRAAGQRCGFRLVGFQGVQGVIAHVDFDRRQRVGKYGVDVETIDRLADASLPLSGAVDLYLVDEIGRMECLSERFASQLTALLDSGKRIIATVASRGGGLIEAVKLCPDCELWELTRGNRESLVARAIQWLEFS